MIGGGPSGPTCLACGALLPEVTSGSDVSCTRCRERYPVRFGIVDLRGGGPLRVADGLFDVQADLAEAAELHAALERTTYRDWFFSGVERRLDGLADPRFRARMRAYYRTERELFGLHGAAILDKLDAFMADREPSRYLRWRRDARVALEAGCGTGQYALGFSPRFARVLVTDISYVSLVQAQKVASEAGLANVRLFASSVERLPLPDASVDFVHCNGVIEHVDEPQRAVDECARVTAPSGVSLILSPNRYSLYSEAHVRVPAFGFWPAPLRRWLAHRVSGAGALAGTSLRSLGEVRRYVRRAFAHHRVYFLPPRLPQPARGGPLRKLVRRLLTLRLTSGAADVLLNRVLLPVAPYHVFLGFKS